MPNKLCYLTPLLAAIAAAAIATAPTSAADAASTQPTAAAAAAAAAVDPTQSVCVSLGGSKTRCQTPGNVQINDSPPPVR